MSIAKRCNCISFLYDIISMDFWERLDEAILRAGMSRKEVAYELGFAVSNFSSWKNRKDFPTADRMVAIARLIGTSVEALVGNDIPTGFLSGSHAIASRDSERHFDYPGLDDSTADRQLLDRARFYHQTITDLDDLDENVRAPWLSGIHAAAELARQNHRQNTANA